MTGAPRHLSSVERDLHLSPEDFRRLADLAYAEAGIAVPWAKEPLVYARLVRRLRELSLPSFGAYVDLLTCTEAAEERALFVSAMTTNTTRFFREQHHFDLLADRVLAPLIAAARRGARVRLWSAGCSSGEEPFSIAITVLSICPEAPTLDLKILATDIDHEVLTTARTGNFSAASLACLPESTLKAHFGQPDPEGGRQVASDLRALVSFKIMNLVRPWPMTGPFDVIFCRNVAIYFDSDTQDRIWKSFAATLRPGGHLFIGHSERLSRSVRHEFETIGMTSFRLRAPQSPSGTV
ncbi:protein-glutamate O-methyltransferase [Cereibacter azotoformans]|uniref:Chemotaxis protein methyltransferase n=1 Tax=Cereibacter azotoformans TaxID=43057 RepID=A0A2T5KDQ6_9RHOB|nr:protein-glutamate O-methyltransferase [Cereibacter azotoformans]AXQ93747.1 chemotaxis protein [Cereibacter sphaeroides]MBO4168456.1 protein-glutamate O-methyltransferase [Cereibacter azotoformans]PTR20555.1 chemotaxis protein methyltransferase CheR [Cereibacter azotoformans]UIJ29257.1 protein-glutamate O-methyltransferase [Cereibacter azotoformans]